MCIVYQIFDLFIKYLTYLVIEYLDCDDEIHNSVHKL